MDRETLADIVFWAAVIIAIIIVVWNAVGDSPSVKETISGGIVAILGVYYRLKVKLEQFHSDLNVHRTTMEHTLSGIEDVLKTSTRRLPHRTPQQRHHRTNQQDGFNG